MQTFVPEGSNLTLGFERLDYRRLGKQRVEAWQILNILRGVDNQGNPRHHGGWANHPATVMWRGFPHGLAIYGKLCCEEWILRGYKDTMLPRFEEVRDMYHEERPWAEGTDIIWPPWLFDDAVAESHRSNLIRKAPEHYTQFWPNTGPDLEYIWPTTPWKSLSDQKGLTSSSPDDMMRISNEGNALTMRKGQMMATKKKAKVEVLDELEELEELEELDEEVEPAAEAIAKDGMLTAKAAASMLGTDGRTLRKFLRKKNGVLGQGKRWELDPDDFDELKAEFDAAHKAPRKKAEKADDGDDKPKGKVVKTKSAPIGGTDDELYGPEDEDDLDDDAIIEDLADLTGPDDDDLEDLDDFDFDD